MALSKKILIGLILLSFALTVLISRSDITTRKERLENVVSLHVERIRNEVLRAVYATEVLKEVTRASQGNLLVEDFNGLARAVGDGINYITIQYMEGGIVKYAYPLEGNEATIGHDVLASESTAVEAQMAMEKNKFTVSGPFSLMQGMQGLAIRNPLFLENEDGLYFWGFITIVLPVPEILRDTGVFELEELGYQYKIIAQYKNEDITFIKTPRYNESYAMSLPIEIGDNTWTLSMYRTTDNRAVWQNAMFFALICMLISFGIYLALKRVERRLNNDMLTGAYNRRFLENYIKSKHITKSYNFVLFYIDLNDFKPVNDTYGHEAGDLLLISFVKRVQGNIKSDGAIYRIGGDEFVVIVPSIKTDEAIQRVVERISTLAKKPFTVNNQKLSISASIGVASFPNDGADIKTLLQIADERMYEDKQAYKKAKKTIDR